MKRDSLKKVQPIRLSRHSAVPVVPNASKKRAAQLPQRHHSICEKAGQVLDAVRTFRAGLELTFVKTWTLVAITFTLVAKSARSVESKEVSVYESNEWVVLLFYSVHTFSKWEKEGSHVSNWINAWCLSKMSARIVWNNSQSLCVGIPDSVASCQYVQGSYKRRSRTNMPTSAENLCLCHM